MHRMTVSRPRQLPWIPMLAAAALAAGCSSQNSTVLPLPSSPTGSQPVVLEGSVRESGSESPIEGATVCWSQRCAQSTAEGTFRLDTETVFGTGHAPCLVAYSYGFETRNDCLSTGLSGTAAYNPVLQRVITITAGESVSGTVFWDDGGGFDLEDFCERCKRIRVFNPNAGQLVTTLMPDTSSAQLRLSPSGPVRVQAGATVVLIIGAQSQQPFHLDTQLIPE